MLTPQEVSEWTFPRATFGGYSMPQVDKFLDTLTGDYSALYNENAVLKSKMKVLVDQVEEYRATEETMRKALMTAQRIADEQVRQAEQKKAEVLCQAEEEARHRSAELGKVIEAEVFRLQQAKQATAAFVAKVRALVAQQETFLSQLADLCPPESAQTESKVEETAEEIDDSVQRLLAKAMMDAAVENMKSRQEPETPEDLSDTAEFAIPPAPAGGVTPPAKPAAKPAEPTPPAPQSGHIDFGSLQFGRDYEIK